jgi:hypothetical protein
MELKIDLSKNKKSVFVIILGILFSAISIAWLLIDHRMNTPFSRTFDWIFFTLMILNGILYTIKGFGLSVGKAFILIDHKIISIKKDILQKEQCIEWNDINSIEYKINDIEILKKNGTVESLKIKSLGYSLIKEIKQVISELANEKRIEIK